MLGKKVAQGVFPTTKALPEIPQEITACMSLLSLLYHSQETVFLNLLFWQFFETSNVEQNQIEHSPTHRRPTQLWLAAA